MRRIYLILLILWITATAMLVLYGFVPPARAWMDETLGPRITNVSSGVVTTITASPIWINYIVPFPNQMIWGALLLGLPIFWLFLKVRTRVRRTVFRGAAKDSGMYPTVTEPISSPVAPAQPAPTVKTETKSEPAPAPETKKET